MIRDFTSTATLVVFVFELAVLLRAMLRPQREPASRVAWLIAILVLPVVGTLAYLLLGEARVSQRRRARFAAIEARPAPAPAPVEAATEEAAAPVKRRRSTKAATGADVATAFV